MVRGAKRRVARGLVRLAQPREGLDRDGTLIALTFDDGPDPASTPAILDELRDLGVEATFFLVGRRARAHPGLVHRILDEGHAIGSHSTTHPQAWSTPFPALLRDYRRGRSEVEEVAGREVRLFRPPNGYLDGPGAAAMVLTRLRPWLWTVDPEDWQPGARPPDILRGLEGLRGGDVILLHDALDGPEPSTDPAREATRAALADIVALAADRGLAFTTLG